MKLVKLKSPPSLAAIHYRARVPSSSPIPRHHLVDNDKAG
jgi:hypothetical protein